MRLSIISNHIYFYASNLEAGFLSLNIHLNELMDKTLKGSNVYSQT
jgi:hypothetical protein